MLPRAQIEIDYAHLAEGERKSGQMCPFCNGGTHGERSLAVNRSKGTLWYTCFRASCMAGGRVDVASRGSSSVKSGGELKPSFEVVSGPLPQDMNELLEAMYSIEPGMFEWAGWVYTKDYRGFGPRVGMPILNPEGQVRGYSWRSYVGVVPKSLIAKTKEEEMMCWYRGRKYGKVLVIVEDQPSALRIASQELDSLALLGTRLSLDRIYEIKKQNYDRVFLCLDEDATANAVKHTVAFKARLPQLSMIALAEDIKDMDPTSFEMFIQKVSLP